MVLWHSNGGGTKRTRGPSHDATTRLDLYWIRRIRFLVSKHTKDKGGGTVPRESNAVYHTTRQRGSIFVGSGVSDLVSKHTQDKKGVMKRTWFITRVSVRRGMECGTQRRGSIYAGSGVSFLVPTHHHHLFRLGWDGMGCSSTRVLVLSERERERKRRDEPHPPQPSCPLPFY